MFLDHDRWSLCLPRAKSGHRFQVGGAPKRTSQSVELFWHLVILEPFGNDGYK